MSGEIAIKELIPLIQKAEIFSKNEESSDIYAYVLNGAQKCVTPNMGQSLCEHIITMCHPRAWGDRCVNGVSWKDYDAQLSELSFCAQEVGQKIYESY